MNLHRRLWILVLMAPGSAWADDLGNALAYIHEAGVDETIEGWERLAEPDSNEAMAMLVSRDVRPGAALDSYDCFDSAIDQPVMRTSGEEKLALRYCMESRWERDRLEGYRTLGEVRLDPKQVADAVVLASRETHVPAAVLDLIIRYSSGYRPGVVSEDGHYGLMQLSPKLLREVGIEFDNLLDARENIFVGARYLARLTHRFSDLSLALAAYHDGPGPVEAAGRQIPKDRRTIWFVREICSLYYASQLDVPEQIAVESMAFVWTWMD